MNIQQHGYLVSAISLIAIGFGLLTIKEGGMTLSGDEAAVSATGNYVPLLFAAFGVHVMSGGLYEKRTVIAMSMRTLVWVTIATIAWRRLTEHSLGRFS